VVADSCGGCWVRGDDELSTVAILYIMRMVAGAEMTYPTVGVDLLWGEY